MLCRQSSRIRSRKGKSERNTAKRAFPPSRDGHPLHVTVGESRQQLRRHKVVSVGQCEVTTRSKSSVSTNCKRSKGKGLESHLVVREEPDALLGQHSPAEGQ